MWVSGTWSGLPGLRLADPKSSVRYSPAVHGHRCPRHDLAILVGHYQQRLGRSGRAGTADLGPDPLQLAPRRRRSPPPRRRCSGRPAAGPWGWGGPPWTLFEDLAGVQVQGGDLAAVEVPGTLQVGQFQASGDTLVMAIYCFCHGLSQTNVCCPCSGSGGNVVQRPVGRVRTAGRLTYRSAFDSGLSVQRVSLWQGHS